LVEVGSGALIYFNSATTGTSVGAGKLEGGDANVGGTIAADPAADGYAIITNTLIASEGSAILNIPATYSLDIQGTLTAKNAANAYDSLTISGATISDAAVFNASAGNASLALTGTLTAAASGSTFQTKGTGILNIGSIASLVSPATQNLNGVVLSGTNGLTTGTLTLMNNGYLALSGAFNVGSASSSATLSPGLGSIYLPSGSSIVVAPVTTVGPVDYKGALVLNNYTIIGLSPTSIVDAYSRKGAHATGDVAGANDVFIGGIGDISPTPPPSAATNGGAAVITYTPATGGSVIGANSLTHTITGSSKLYTGN
jgi:hypothetical protein